MYNIENIAACIITYNPDINRLEENIKAIVEQVSVIYIIDNNSKNMKKYENKIYDIKKCKITKLNDNMGVAFALNKAIELSREMGYSWLLTMDQDSIASENYVNICCDFVNNNNNIGIITPLVIDRNLSNNGRFIPVKEHEKVTTCITSGAFTNIEAVIKCGGFDNDFFIDSVDFDMCLNMRQHGYFIYKLNTISILHELGKIDEKEFLGKKFYSTNHSPQRVYYIYRNFFILKKKYKNFSKNDIEVAVWFRNATQYLNKKTFVRFIFEKQKFKKFISMLKGLFSALYYR